MKVLEEKALGDKKLFGGDSINLVDISFRWIPHWLESMEEVVGIKLLDPNTLPCLHAWIQNFKQVAVIRENLPHQQKLLAYMKHKREKLLEDLSSKPTIIF
ncbi:Glutathione transferase [Bertholletia excelsa]